MSATDRTIVDDNGEEYDPIPYGSEDRWGEIDDVDPPSGDDRCHDCGAAVGEAHMAGCDMEQCPICHGQYLSCACRTNEDEDTLMGQDWFDPDDPVSSLREAKRD